MKAMAAVNKAYDILSDAEKRKRYDSDGEENHKPKTEDEIVRDIFYNAMSQCFMEIVVRPEPIHFAVKQRLQKEIDDIEEGDFTLTLRKLFFY